MSGPEPLVLASASPRRSEILRTLGLAHEVRPARIDETPLDGESAASYVERLARAKAAAVARERPDSWVLAGDTIVTLDDELLGKPRDTGDAVRMLLRLAGGVHRVVSALAFSTPGGRQHSGVEATEVRFGPFGPEVAAAYVATGEPMGKAGAYAIQGRGAALVEEIHGDYFTVVGLPVSLLVRLLDEVGRPYWPAP